jgi:hypothetical protein
MKPFRGNAGICKGVASRSESIHKKRRKNRPR